MLSGEMPDTNILRLRRLGLEVREHREKLGLSQERFAERAGLSADFVGRIELGKQAPGFEALVAIAGAARVRVWHLFARADI